LPLAGSRSSRGRSPRSPRTATPPSRARSTRSAARRDVRYGEEDVEEDDPDHDAEDDVDDDHQEDDDDPEEDDEQQQAARRSTVDRAHVRAVHDGAMHDIMAMTRRPYAKKKNRGAIKDQPSKGEKLEEMEAAEERLQTQMGPGWCAELQIGDGKTGTANLAKRRLSAQTASIRRSIPARSNSKKSHAKFSMAEFEYANTLLDLFSQGALPLTQRTGLSDLMCKVLHCPDH
jgi:hypothetical protein